MQDKQWMTGYWSALIGTEQWMNHIVVTIIVVSPRWQTTSEHAVSWMFPFFLIIDLRILVQLAKHSHISCSWWTRTRIEKYFIDTHTRGIIHKISTTAVFLSWLKCSVNYVSLCGWNGRVHHGNKIGGVINRETKEEEKRKEGRKEGLNMKTADHTAGQQILTVQEFTKKPHEPLQCGQMRLSIA